MAAHYRALATAVRAAPGAPLAAFADRLDAAAGDELRHAALCDELAPAPWPSSVPAAPPIDDPLLAIAVACCIGETLNVALLHHELGCCGRDERAATRALLADEMRHARLGWDVLAAAAAHADLSALAAPLAAALADARARPSDGAASALEPADRAVLLEAAIEELIVPGLARYGAWSDRSTWSSSSIRRCTPASGNAL